MHDQATLGRARQAAPVQPVMGEVGGLVGQFDARHALLLQAQHHHGIGTFDGFVEVSEALAFDDIVGGRHQLGRRSEEHTSELQSLMRISYAVFCLKKKTSKKREYTTET